MNYDKVKQIIGLFGGWLSAILLFLQSLNIEFDWFNQDTIGTFTNVLIASIPFILVAYGVYKNSYVVTKKAKEQEATLKYKGMK